MKMEDHDWLDQRLAADNYLPDEGFTARVMERLPAKRTRPMRTREGILAVAAFAAICLAAVQVVPLFQNIQQFATHHPIQEMVLGLAGFLQQPMVLAGAGLGMTLLTVASIPLLRRWA
jgi:hypothetical protein